MQVSFDMSSRTSDHFAAAADAADAGGQVEGVAVCCSVLQCVAVLRVLQCVAVYCGVLRCNAVDCNVLQTLQTPAGAYSVLQCVAVLSALQCIVVCCSVLQC